MRFHNCPPGPWSTVSERASCSPPDSAFGRSRRFSAGLVANFWQFIIAVRVLLGAGESPQFPTLRPDRGGLVSKREAGPATGVWGCSSCLGTAVAAPLLTYLMIHFGWRWMFVAMGVAGLGVALAAYWLHRNPGRDVR